jgi:polar amino acid transport system permease protein
MVATVWYIVLTTLLSIAQYYIERHYARGSARALPLTPWHGVVAKYREIRDTSHGAPRGATR